MGRGWRELCLIVLPTVAIAAWAPNLYGNVLLLFNFVLYITLAQGMNAIYGFTGYLPFGYVGFFGAGAYGFAIAAMAGVHPAAALAVAGGAGIALGLILTPLLRLSGAYFAIANLAAAQAVYQVVANPALAPITKGPYGVSLSAVFAPRASYLVAVALMGATMAAIVWLRNGRFGLALMALRDDPVSAASAGVNIVRARTIAWLLSALVASLAGGAFAWQISVFYPETAFDMSISIFAIVFTLFGGAGTLLGPLIGVLLLYGVYNWIGIAVPQYFQLIYGALIVVLVLFLPNGLVSLLTQRGIRVP
ncbi:branched-chain amino acid ABC transporter permease [Acidisphaera rubrifaciens]|uniref:Innermembrane translocator n=1 Tax=Acidisphaera rubrifaciens HS-AP3 TaxID=1231350 RepID=A0A0D6P938_9PROT|nr:branched-chain amino acid ABC transporter permease [Acidisphaera rubrifaciens]GAN77708.1 innermembrane translocator [Acidisphaera rubrifaciens HS-AP3]